jgi:hypothetical protein
VKPDQDHPPVTIYTHLHTDLRSHSRNLQVTHEPVSDIYVSFAISDFADVHSAFHGPFGDGRP